MPQITLKRKQVQDLVDFCRKHERRTYFLAKDEGAYVGAVAGKYGTDDFERVIFYFSGCDPKKDRGWYDNARDKFGGDDFGEDLPIADLESLLKDPRFVKAVIKVTPSSISVHGYVKREA